MSQLTLNFNCIKIEFVCVPGKLRPKQRLDSQTPRTKLYALIVRVPDNKKGKKHEGKTCKNQAGSTC